MSKRSTVSGVLMIALILATIPLLGSDNVPFLKWWLMAMILGIGFFPVTAVLFSTFRDRGWLFSKVFGIAVSGFVVFALTSAGLTRFTAMTCILTTVVLMILSWAFGLWKIRVHSPDVDLIFLEELLFLLFFLLWTYLAGFHPEAHGTEKFMDYGFMEALMRSETLPAEDIWYSGSSINYYYGGQYYAVFLTKLSFTEVRHTYHLMRTMTAAFAFVLPFSITYHLLRARTMVRIRKEGGKERALAPILGGLLSGGAVSLAGNFHYVIYGCIRPWLGMDQEEGYWFPDSTRYIGYDPVVENDRTIHEFPSYSFVLGDLHAHVVNVMFVLFLVGLMYSFVREVCREPDKENRWSFQEVLLRPHILAAGFLIGLFHWTNYWDFVIYFVVVLSFVLYAALYRYHCRWKETIGTVLIQAAEVFTVGTVTALPFTMKFETMVFGVALAKHHSLLYQLAILWGLPVTLTVIFFAAVYLVWKRSCYLPMMEAKRGRIQADGKTQEEVEQQAVELLLGEKNKAEETSTGEETTHKRSFREFWRDVPVSDLAVCILGICAIGLVLIPEFVYVRDIYEASYARSNTMFKLTYQAFILFGISMGYILVRFILWKKERILQAFGVLGLVLLLWTFGYFPVAVQSWFGNVLDPDEYRGLDATAYLENVFPEDAGAIRWLQSHVEGQEVVLEANGDSYSDYERVSAMTGLPTVLGWYVHEWLWRGDPGDLNERSMDIQTIYTSQIKAEVIELLDKYQVSYIFVGSKEREKYEGDLNETLLLSLGEVVYQDPESSTYILKLASQS
ncbi:MAG: DUF2298 domain-containing protein [Fusicatenibacter sp.]